MLSTSPIASPKLYGSRFHTSHVSTIIPAPSPKPLTAPIKNPLTHPLMQHCRTTLEAYKKKVESMVTPKRYAHILRVIDLTQTIAKANYFSKQDCARAELAALLHDAARDLSVPEMFRLCPPSIPMERENPMTLHGQAGAVLAEQWGVHDALVLDAIAGHVFCVNPHNHIGMAVYIADISEPARGVNEDIRDLAMDDLYQAYQQAVYSKISYLQSCDKTVHPRTLAAYQALQQQHELQTQQAQQRTQIKAIPFGTSPYRSPYQPHRNAVHY